MAVKVAKRSREEQPLLLRTDNGYERALRQDEALRGTGRDKEAAFRRTLGEFLEDYDPILDRQLYALVLDHLTRTDRLGLSLCFNGPLRQGMLAEVGAWLARVNQPAASVRWQALASSQQNAGGVL